MQISSENNLFQQEKIWQGIFLTFCQKLLAAWKSVFVWSDQTAGLEIQCATRDSAHAQNGECGYAGIHPISRMPKKRQKLPISKTTKKRQKKLWKERDVTLAPRNVECDDIRIFPLIGQQEFSHNILCGWSSKIWLLSKVIVSRSD